MSARGADFSEWAPKNALGILSNIPFVGLLPGARDLEHGVIQQLTPNNSFRYGQQLFLKLGIANTISVVDSNFFTRLRLKPWWAQSNMEFRQPGVGGYLPIDTQVFAGDGLANNRYIWLPSPKRQDTTPETTPPPAAAEPRTSDSVFLDDVWTFDLQDPNDAAYQADFQTGQVASRWIPIFYPSHGFALGFTWDADYDQPAGDPVLPLISLTFIVGTLGGTAIQESIG